MIDRGWGYAFDNIGNRTSSSVIGNGGGDTHTTSYTVNNLNQVTARSGPGSVDVTGLAPSSATVTVNSSTATRQGEYYYKNVTASSPPAWQSVAASSSAGGSETRHSFVPGASETHTYDDDGNLTADGRWSYTWDAENRLVSMETVSGAYSVGVPRQFIQFKYDYLGRRVRKTVANWNSMTSTYDAALDRKFLYNGWNLLAEYDVGTGLVMASAYIWGLDLSGNLVDGGGVGGLLAIKQVSGSVWHLPYYDANGNLHALVDRSTGTVTAAYEYSPFGETLRANGSYAASNPFRFSTKYADTETHLLYYGYRYYDPSMGRWLGRDPSGESGGLHLYAFCRNNAVNAYDGLGLTGTRNIAENAFDDEASIAGFLRAHPTFSRVNYNTWHDPEDDLDWVFTGHVDSGDDQSSENFDAPQNLWDNWGNDIMNDDEASLGGWRQSAASYTAGFVNYTEQVQAAIDAKNNALAAVDQGKTLVVVTTDGKILIVVPDAGTTSEGQSNTAGLIASNGDGMYTDGTRPWVSNGGEAVAAGKSAPNSGVAAGPSVGDVRLIAASAGFQDIHLGAPGQAAAANAALANFVDASTGFLSPFSWMTGVPNPFSQEVSEKLDAFQTFVIDPTLGESGPSLEGAAKNLMKQGIGILANAGGPYMGVTMTQTQTYTEKSYLFGLIKTHDWVDNAPVYTQVNNQVFFSKSSAAAAATRALQNQLVQQGFIKK